jgi:hypothetical protein
VKAEGRLPARPLSVTVTSTVPAERVDVVAVSVVGDGHLRASGEIGAGHRDQRAAQRRPAVGADGNH